MSELRRILLHVCCGPCATHSIERLASEGFEVTLFFANSNISPRSEFDKRLREVEKLAAACGRALVVDEYDHESWLAAIRGFEDAPEKGERCRRCFEFNLGRAAEFARGNGFEAFTTTLTISPHKSSADIFGIGSSLGDFLSVDFKKRDGFRKSLALSRRYELYRQDYCGCEFSRRPA